MTNNISVDRPTPLPRFYLQDLLFVLLMAYGTLDVKQQSVNVPSNYLETQLLITPSVASSFSDFTQFCELS